MLSENIVEPHGRAPVTEFDARRQIRGEITAHGRRNTARRCEVGATDVAEAAADPARLPPDDEITVDGQIGDGVRHTRQMAVVGQGEAGVRVRYFGVVQQQIGVYPPRAIGPDAFGLQPEIGPVSDIGGEGQTVVRDPVRLDVAPVDSEDGQSEAQPVVPAPNAGAGLIAEKLIGAESTPGLRVARRDAIALAGARAGIEAARPIAFTRLGIEQDGVGQVVFHDQFGREAAVAAVSLERVRDHALGSGGRFRFNAQPEEPRAGRHTKPVREGPGGFAIEGGLVRVVTPAGGVEDVLRIALGDPAGAVVAVLCGKGTDQPVEPAPGG